MMQTVDCFPTLPRRVQSGSCALITSPDQPTVCVGARRLFAELGWGCSKKSVLLTPAHCGDKEEWGGGVVSAVQYGLCDVQHLEVQLRHFVGVGGEAGKRSVSAG